MELRIKAVTDTGCVRDHNEDRILIGDEILREGDKEIEINLNDNPKYFVAIADGMGGHNAGEVASEMVLELMREKINSFESGLTENELSKKIKDWTYEIHSHILEEGNRSPERKGMGTTLVGILCYENSAYYLNVGDSRLYRLRDECLVQISKDHSLRELTGDNNLPSNIILNSFGGGDKVFVDFAPVSKRIFEGDILLLCSDGLSDMLTDDEIEMILNSGEDSVNKLLTEAKNKGGEDNISIISITIGMNGNLS
ncbi:MAG: protein phosphatase 2C domain-containing protein [bacterium]